jgi:hypothetical protein
MSSTNHIGTTVMIPVGFLDVFDEFVEDRGTDRSEEIRAAYRDHIKDPPSVGAVASINDELDAEGVPRPHVKVMMDADLLRRDKEFRDERGTDRSGEVCAAMAEHLDTPLDVADVTDDPVAKIRAKTDGETHDDVPDR